MVVKVTVLKKFSNVSTSEEVNSRCSHHSGFFENTFSALPTSITRRLYSFSRANTRKTGFTHSCLKKLHNNLVFYEDRAENSTIDTLDLLRSAYFSLPCRTNYYFT